MNNLINFEDFTLNEGKLLRGAIKVLIGGAITIGKIKNFLTGSDRKIPYKVGIVASNLMDFILTMKKNPDVITYYEGNYLDEYKKLHGSDIIDDLDYLLNLMNEEISKEKDVLKLAKMKSGKAKIEEIKDALEDIGGVNRGGGFVFNTKTGKKSNFQGRLDKLRGEHGIYHGDISKE